MSGERRRITIPNFVEIGQSVVNILRFFDFSRWRLPPCWIFVIMNFYLLTVSGGPRCITVPNFIQSVVPLLKYCDFLNFQDGRRHLGFLKSWYFIGYWGPEGRDASACQISSKSLNQLCPQSWIPMGHISTSHTEYLWVSITLQNLVMIDAVVFIIITFQHLTHLVGKCLFT